MDVNTALVTAYVSEQGANNWKVVKGYENVPVTLEDGLLRLAFVGTTYATYHTNEAWYARLYMDNVSMYGVNKDVTKKPPVISGIKNGFTYYIFEKQEMSVVDHDLDEVTINGTPVEVKTSDTGFKATYKFDTAGTYTIVAKDKAGNTTEYRIYVKATSKIFESNFNTSTNTSLISDGWTAHSDRENGGKATNNDVRVVNSKSADTPVLNFASKSYGNGTGPRIYKNIEVDNLEHVVVEFDLRMIDNGAVSGTSGNDKQRAEDAPTFYVGTLKDNDVTSRYVVSDPTNSNLAQMTQIYWSADKSMATGNWMSVRLAFEILDSDSAKVTAYVKNGTTWEQSGETTEITLSNGELQLAFACRAFTKGEVYNEAFLDNVEVYGVSSN